MIRDIVLIIFIAIVILLLVSLFHRQKNFDTIMISVAVAGIIYALTRMKQDKYVVEGE